MIMRTLFTVFLVLAATALCGAQTSPHGKLKIPCQSCHTTDSWTMRTDASFDHSTTGFALEGQHRTAKCTSCHKNLTFTGTKPLCSSCHVDVHKSELGANCARCHSPKSWKITDMIQRHQSTRFPLLGRHATLDCQDCHTNVVHQRYTGVPVTCFGCHRSDFEKTANPNHTAAGFSTDCSQCHKLTSFEWTSGFDHALTSFPLTGAHRSVSCSSCHTSGVFQNAPTACFACHQSN